MQCPRCGAPAEGAHCQSCGESLAFAPPRDGTEADVRPAAPFEPPHGFGWLAAAGVVQILLGVGWLLVALAVALTSKTALADALGRRFPELETGTLQTGMTVVWIFSLVFAAMTLAISICVIVRYRWAWLISLIFDALWAVLGVVALAQLQPLGLLYIGTGGALICFLLAGRAALRR